MHLEYASKRQPDYLPSYVTRQMEPDASSLTSNDPSFATATPTGRPHTLPSGVTNPVRKSSYSPVAFPSFTGTRMTSYPARSALFQEPCSAPKMSPLYSFGN